MPERLHIEIKGIVQGVGFRPYISRLANDLNLRGWVRNTSNGLELEVEGDRPFLERFSERLTEEPPVGSQICQFSSSHIPKENDSYFSIQKSSSGLAKQAFITADVATCSECLQELFNPRDRRYLYPFISCSSCGPRFSITESLPFDRSRTSMRHFPMCSQCQEEFEFSDNRRFHAQTIACSACGPEVSFLDSNWMLSKRGAEAVHEFATLIRRGKVLALKGIGGFHIVCDARDSDSVQRLRKLKARGNKSFALMYPSLAVLEAECFISDLERKLLESREAPIVLLTRKSDTVSDNVAPNSPYLGVMLPYTPLHYIILRHLTSPVVATSANISGDPICHTELKLKECLSGMIDGVLTHNRDIIRAVDDSVVQTVCNAPQVLRLGRGYAPFITKLENKTPKSYNVDYISVGAQQKNAIAFLRKDTASLGQHIGDLETLDSVKTFKASVEDYTKLFSLKAGHFISDLHPDYSSSVYVRKRNSTPVQHHLAHILSLAAERSILPPYLGIAWDGSGLGTDNTVWGGEFLLVTEGKWKRAASIYPFRLPGGEHAVREPRLIGAALLYEVFGKEFFSDAPESFRSEFTEEEHSIIPQMISKGINSPLTSSMGRLFDGVSSLLGIVHRSSFEGEAAMQLEYISRRSDKPAPSSPYPFELIKCNNLLVFDWREMIKKLVYNSNSDDCCTAAQRFHATLASMACPLVEHIGEKTVLLSGGCFQNRLLTESMVSMLRNHKFDVHWHSKTPPNDGGIALGQLNAFYQELSCA